MTFEEIEKSIRARERQLDVVVGTLTRLAERVTQFLYLAEIQNVTLTRLEDRL